MRFVLVFIALLAASAAAQPVLLQDIASGGAGSGIGEIVRLGDRGYFGACGATCGLWRTTGTSGGTRVLIESVAVGQIVALQNWVYLIDESGDEPGLWRTNGQQRERMVVPSGPVRPTHLGAALADDVVFFAARDARGSEPWATQPGSLTLRVADIHPDGDSDPRDFSTVGDQVVFWADDGADGRELWRTNGASTSRIGDLRPGAPSSFVRSDRAVLGGHLYFAADDGASGAELWRTDAQTAERVADLRPGPEGSDPTGFVVAGGWLYLAADDGARGRELWRTDGTTLEPVPDLAPGASGADLAGMAALGDRLYVVADVGEGIGRELYWTDGGTPTLTLDLWPGSQSAFPDGLDADTLGGSLYARASVPGAGAELVRIGPDGVFFAADVWPGDASGAPTSITALPDVLVFAATDGASGAEPFAYVPGVVVASDPEPTPEAALRIAPNPFRSRASLSLSLPEPREVRIAVADVRGREVRVVYEGALGAGETRWPLAERLAPGVYVVHARVGAEHVTTRAVVAR